MLGILKAGGVFAALDPLQSHQRLEEMVRILGCTVLITSDLHVAKVSSLVAHALVLPCDALPHPPNSSSIGNTAADTPQPETSLQPDDAAFILFTSGSTGHPKAILHEHGAVCSHALALGDAMGYAKARVLQFAAYVWDVAVIDVFITLIFGGCVCIPSEEDRLSNIAAFIQWSEANLAILTPSYARTIDPETVPSLKTLGLAGECLTPEDVDRWRGRLTLMNVYGPAEVGACTLNTAVTALATGEREGIRTGGVKNIGPALRSSPCWLVDPTDPNILVPVGAVGELLVSGPNLAREYLDLPAQTAASFIQDPTWAAALDLNGPRRFYRTGDLARYDISAFDGSLVFMGRKDDQMKVRGQRIEPGEIEYHLQRVPGVKGAVVAIPACGPRKGELVAVVTTSQGQDQSQDHAHLNPLHGLSAETLPLSRIQDSISEALPDYMVPTACVVLAHLPLTASMKINRKEVKAWLEKMDDSSQPQECSTAAAAAAAVATLAETEQTAWVISTLLDEYLRSLHPDRPVRLEALGYDLSLHSAGLDSIQMITFLSMLRKRFGDVLSFPAVMKTRLLTVRSLAGLIDNTRTAIPPRSFQSVEIEAEIEELTQQLRKRLQSSNTQVHDNEIGIATAQAPRNVFLTGASGYLGNQILRELLSQPDMHFYILMRRPPPSGNNMPYEKSPPPNDPIRETAMLEGWWNRSLQTRYTIWPGDLAEKNLGLARSQLRLLAGQGPAGECVHGIIHCGAVVHYTLDYESLQAANVLSTMTLLEIMGRSKVLSTFVFVSGGRNPTSMHTESPKPKQKLEEDSLWNGYSQSKYISERLTLESPSALSPYFQDKHLCTVNPGYIIGSATTNWRANTRDFIWRLVAGCLEIGLYNQDEEYKWLFVSDVASVSRVVVTALLNPDPNSSGGGGAHAITEGIPFHTLWAILQHEYGYRLTGVPGTQWLQALRANVLGAGESHPLFTLLPVLETHGLHLGGQYDHSFGESNATAECVRRNIAYLASIGFLPRPSS
ncbi:hypothetical protein ASPCADRAFT_141925 [Aspergillus carbonarius ITEM 5010]|uniref:Carrier domain-containing protein n=1 Tax=Aspergillus carbonarius (strain ITEM 5010) TaxID=602072 RepID=A0A1R3RU83_ASPC5|nr:hypothetical protein ASPCADRAFT_141925 [Aspergillus carbonarius ITEM 5010]